MRKRKGARSDSEASKTLINSASASASCVEEAVQNHSHNQNENEDCEGDRFFACYLLASLSPRYKGHTYIGFTVNPRRRIRQHNGEIGCGAWRTKKRRPWEMVLCIYGFPTNVSALQFEWAWQHPVESLAVRKAAAGFKSLSGIGNKIKLAYTMLTLPSWQSMNITVNFFSTKYTKHCAGCPSLPDHMKIEIGSMDELPCYTERVGGLSENEDDSIDKLEVEFDDNNTSGSVLDASNAFVNPDSPKNPNHEDTASEAFEWIKESEAREPPDHSFALQEPSQSPSAIKRVESSVDLSQQESEQWSATPAVAYKNCDVRSTFIVPQEAEIIDLSTPSPSCRSILDRKKRRVGVGADYIDLTKSPNFVQL